MDKIKYILVGIIVVLVGVIIYFVVFNRDNDDRISSKNNDDISLESIDENNVEEVNNQSLDDAISFEDDKINIFFFWGDGCPHCEEMFKFLDSIQSEYGKYYNVYSFEVWLNEDNGKIMDYFLGELGKTVGSRGVPVYIIGDVYFEGFSSNMKEDILNTIVSEYDDRDNVRDFSGVLNIE